jgi:hypothetical protein
MLDLDGTRDLHEDRRKGGSRRAAASDQVAADRRSGVERRSGLERRSEELDTISSQVLAALGLITRAVESSPLRDDQRRLLDAAMLRLRFALEKLGG